MLFACYTGAMVSTSVQDRVFCYKWMKCAQEARGMMHVLTFEREMNHFGN